ncbi:MAG: M20/M25/M40 family metallo-hydrolase [Candidatus Acidiferrales bacterium]
MDTVLKTLADNEGLYLRELAEFVGIPSVSTDPAHAADVRRAAEWVAERLRKAGPIEVNMWETQHHPAVFGRWNGASGAPTVLIYGHVDVQPAEPVELWHLPPFVLTARNGRLYGRGVSDEEIGSVDLPELDDSIRAYAKIFSVYINVFISRPAKQGGFPPAERQDLCFPFVGVSGA